jgi:polar amino acid transport system substrate-binding protein
MRRRALLAVAPALLALAAGRGRATEPKPAPAAEIARILERGRLVVAVAGFALPPFVTADADGRLSGYDIELARGMAGALGVKASFDDSGKTLDAVIAAAARGDADLAVSKIGATLDWATRVRFSRPYLRLREAWLVNRPRFARIAAGREPDEVVHAAGTVVGTVAGSASAESARRRLPEARVLDYPRFDREVVDAVLAGEIVAGLGDEIDVRRVLAARPDAPLRLRAQILPERLIPVVIALPRDSLQLLAWVDLYLDTVAPAVTADDLLARSAKPAE